MKPTKTTPNITHKKYILKKGVLIVLTACDGLRATFWTFADGREEKHTAKVRTNKHGKKYFTWCGLSLVVDKMQDISE